jgi:signal peptidase II
MVLVGIVFVLTLALDLWTKSWAWEHLRDQPAVEVIPRVFYLKFGFNTGSAFSFLRDESWARSFFITVTFLALFYMAWLAWKMPTKKAYGFVAVGLISAGAAGNLHDRFFRTMEVWINNQKVVRHGVVDFLQVFLNYDEGNYWPIFNVADSALVCGVALLLIFLHYHGAEGELAAAGQADDAANAKAEPADADDADEADAAEDDNASADAAADDPASAPVPA